MSTTELLRWCERECDGSISRAMDVLRFANNHNAKSALRVFESIRRRNPQAKAFFVTPGGCVRVKDIAA